jgi:hypothetical protein
MKQGQRSEVRGQSVRLMALAGAVALSACVERSPVHLEPAPVRADGIVAYLVAAPAALPNEYIVRAVARRGVAVEDPGSFVAAVRLAVKVTYVTDASNADAMRVVSPSDTAFRVAGASPEGLVSSELFALRVRAARATDLNDLRLEVAELNDRSGASLRAVLVIVPHVTWASRP